MARSALITWVVTCAALGLFFVLVKGDLFWDMAQSPEGPNQLQHPLLIEFVTALLAGVAVVMLTRCILPALLLCAALYLLMDIPLWRLLYPFAEISPLLRVLPGLGALTGGAIAYALSRRGAAGEPSAERTRTSLVVGRSVIALTGVAGAFALVSLNLHEPTPMLTVLCDTAAVGALISSVAVAIRHGWL